MVVKGVSVAVGEPRTSRSIRPSLLGRYRSFLLSFSTLATVTNGLLLVAAALTHWLIQQPLISNLLFIASALVGGLPIFVIAARGILKKDFTAGVMVSVAMIAALLIGEFSAAALVAFMMMFGEMLENFTIARSNQALKGLASLIPAQATLLQGEEQRTVPVEQVRIGDVLLVRNGERVPVDGAVREGQAAVDESTITGESIPADKVTGDPVYAGTVNTGGTLEVLAQKVGRDTTLGTIVKLVEDAQKTQAPVQRLANRYARYLVPLTFAVALAVYVITGELVRSVTVLVVVCPCALVLATPTALVAAIGNAARNHVIVKTGAHMETLGKIDVVALDKTGTLTVGQPHVVDVLSLNGMTREEILRYAASAEKVSEHPLGRAIVVAANARGLAVQSPASAEVLTGYGVRAVLDGQQVVVGSWALLASTGIELEEGHKAQGVALAAQGNTVIPVAVGGQPAGLIALADVVRPDVAATVKALRAIGVKRTVMLSGDNETTVQAVAAQAGMDEYHAQMLPGQKLDMIRKLQAQSLRVAYVGDGVNDAPALTVADVGIAMGATGTDIAVETADIALMRDDVESVPFLVALSREALRTIRVSVAFSMSMNLLSVVLGMMGIIGPVLGALMHELSALPVLAYSARLVAYKYRSSVS